MKNKAKIEESGQLFGDFVICNPDKLERAINGTPGAGGRASGGVGKDASPEEILAEYDRLGGLIKTIDGEKVSMGSFFDFKAGKPRANPSVKIIAERSGGLQVNTQEVGDAEDKKKGKGKRKTKSPADVQEQEEDENAE